MRKNALMISLLLLLLLFVTAAASAQKAVGDIITFGTYEQDNNTGNGAEPIEWQVLAVENGRALVISRYILDAKPYYGTQADVTWEISTLRTWLNGDFYNNAFSSSEQTQIAQVTLQNPDNPDFGTAGGNSTVDRIFLLSIDEVSRYFADDASRQCQATVYAKANGVKSYSYSENTIWWLRSPGSYSVTAAGVYSDGAVAVSSLGYTVDGTVIGVRPAFWLDLADGTVDSSAGTTSSGTQTSAPSTPTLSLNVGDTVTFGTYEQDNNTGNGAEPIEWQVLAVENGRALLISRYALDAKPYNEKLVDVSWETSSLRSWLNGDFFNSAFSSSEKAQILQVTLQNPNNLTYGTNGGNSTTDRIFLLSIEEVLTWFADDTARICTPTAYAKEQMGAWMSYMENALWWLRSPGSDSVHASSVTTQGPVDVNGSLVMSDLEIRPAFWLGL